jgi:hypothetical protein
MAACGRGEKHTLCVTLKQPEISKERRVGTDSTTSAMPESSRPSQSVATNLSKIVRVASWCQSVNWSHRETLS